MEGGDNKLILNKVFNPDPQRRIVIRRPVADYLDSNGNRKPIPTTTFGSEMERSDVSKWYFEDVLDVDIYLTSAFRSSRPNEVYLFMDNEYVLLNYAPGNHRVIEGPDFISKGFPSLRSTFFAEWGVDCAFRSHYDDQAFIFCGNFCAHIDYSPVDNDDKVLEHNTIRGMFPCLRGTVFDRGLDAAFEASTTDEAYLFQHEWCAHINYRRDSSVMISKSPISTSPNFSCLKDTIFASGVDAAFASHRTDEAYLFKGDSFVLINFADGHIIGGGVKKILSGDWPSLNSVLPRKNRGCYESESESESEAEAEAEAEAGFEA